MDYLRFCVFFILTGAAQAHIYFPLPGIGMVSLDEHVSCDLMILQSNWVIRNEGEAVSLYCKTKNCNNVNLALEWVDNNNQLVPEVPSLSGISGARYWLKGMLRLDITNLGPQHQGRYSCRANYGSIVLNKTVYLEIIRPLPPTTPSTSTESTTVTTTTSAPITTTSTVTTTSSTASTRTTATAVPVNSTTSSTTEATTTNTTPLPTITTTPPSVTTTIESDDVVADRREISPELSPSQRTEVISNINQSPLSDSGTTGEPEGVTDTSSQPVIFEASAIEGSPSPPNDVSSHASPSTVDSGPVRSVSNPPITSEALPSQAMTDVSVGHAPSSTVVSTAGSLDETEGPLQNSSIGNLPRPAEDLMDQTEDAEETPLDTSNRASNTVEFLAPIDGMAEIRTRKKRASNDTSRGEKSGASYENGTYIFDEGLFPKCSGFGPKAIATIAILGAFCLILLYSFILVLCFPRFRRKGIVVVEKSEKTMEEGCVEGIEIKEKPEDAGSDPNGRISRGEDTLEMVAVNTPETEENQEEKHEVVQLEEDKDEDASKHEVESKDKEPNRESPAPEETETTVVVESQNYVPPVIPVSAPLEEERQLQNDDPVESVETNEVIKEAPLEQENERETHVAPLVPELEQQPEPEQQELPVFDDPEPQEMIVKESLVNGANVELEDKAVDTVELESQDIEDPSLSHEDSSDFEPEPQPLIRMTPPPVFNAEPPAEESQAVNHSRLSNGIGEEEPTEEEPTEQNAKPPQHEEMTKSIEDLPPPPPIPPHLTPPPPPPHAHKGNEAGLEAPDVVSSNVTAV